MINAPLESHQPNEDKNNEEPKKSDAHKQVVKSKTATGSVHKYLTIALSQQWQLERMQDQVSSFTVAAANAKLKAEMEGALSYGRGLKMWENQIDKLSVKNEYERLLKNTFKFSIEKTELEKLQESSKGNLFRSEVEKIREQLRSTDSFWQTLQKEVLASVGSRGLGSMLEQMRNSGVMPDIIGKTGSNLWIDQIKSFSNPLSANAAIYEKMLGHALKSTLGTRSFDDILHALRTPTQEFKKEIDETGRKLANEVLTEVSAEGAFRKFVDSLRGLDPLKQFFLIVIFGPMIVGIVLSVVNPVSDYYVRKWLSDSPQGAEKQAKARVVNEAGGMIVLGEYRLVIARPSLVIRESPAALGKKMGSLEFGTAVRSVKEQEAFTLVEWRGEGDVILAGWVFTRYLKKFR